VPRCYKQGELVVSEVSEELVNELEDCWSSAVVSCCCEKLVVEARGSSGTQEKGNVRR
jgi:hypothetical protein